MWCPKGSKIGPKMAVCVSSENANPIFGSRTDPRLSSSAAISVGSYFHVFHSNSSLEWHGILIVFVLYF